MPRFLRHFRKAILLALEHDVLNTAKAAAFSGMLMFFPAFIVLTAIVAKLPEGPQPSVKSAGSQARFFPQTRYA